MIVSTGAPTPRTSYRISFYYHNSLAQQTMALESCADRDSRAYQLFELGQNGVFMEPQ